MLPISSSPPKLRLLVPALKTRCSTTQTRAPRNHSGFMSWLISRNDDGDLSALSIAASQSSGRGLFANRPLYTGDRLLEISQDLLITPYDLPEEVNDLLPSSLKPWTRLALFIFLERTKGQSSAWSPYIASLPDPAELNNTFLWRHEELSYLKQSPLHRKTQERLDLIKSEFDCVEKVGSSLFNGLSFEDFKQAYATVFSRALAVGEGPTIVLIPMLDFFNHNPTSSAGLSYDGLLNFAVVQADRDYLEGDQVWISYGELSNAELALDYGFTVEDNPYDEAEVSVDGAKIQLKSSVPEAEETLRTYNLTRQRAAEIFSRQIKQHENSILAMVRQELLLGARKNVALTVLRGELKLLQKWLQQIQI